MAALDARPASSGSRFGSEDFERLGAGTITVQVVLDGRTPHSYGSTSLATAVERPAVVELQPAAGRWPERSSGPWTGLFFALPGLVIGPFAGAYIGEFSKGQPIARGPRRDRPRNVTLASSWAQSSSWLCSSRSSGSQHAAFLSNRLATKRRSRA